MYSTRSFLWPEVVLPTVSQIKDVPNFPTKHRYGFI